MNRRSLGLSALYAGALFVGTIAGGAASVPSVYAKAAPVVFQKKSAASQEDVDAPAQAPAQAPAKKKPPIRCKTTKDCPQDQVCSKVSDHKECTVPAIRPPIAPVVT